MFLSVHDDAHKDGRREPRQVPSSLTRVRRGPGRLTTGQIHDNHLNTFSTLMPQAINRGIDVNGCDQLDRVPLMHAVVAGSEVCGQCHMENEADDIHLTCLSYPHSPRLILAGMCTDVTTSWS